MKPISFSNENELLLECISICTPCKWINRNHVKWKEFTLYGNAVSFSTPYHIRRHDIQNDIQVSAYHTNLSETNTYIVKVFFIKICSVKNQWVGECFTIHISLAQSFIPFLHVMSAKTWMFIVPDVVRSNAWCVYQQVKPKDIQLQNKKKLLFDIWTFCKYLPVIWQMPRFKKKKKVYSKEITTK